MKINIPEFDKAIEKTLDSAEYHETPFRHWHIKKFMQEEIAIKIETELQKKDYADWTKFQYEMQNKNQLSDINAFPENAKDLVVYLNSGKFLTKIEKLTGINNLISDPYNEGGGLHEIGRGGYLQPHADFSRHKKLRLQRRLNIIIYFNSNWKSEYKGLLTLFDSKGETPIKEIMPISNSAIIFETTIDSFHGHPDPLMCEDSEKRKSIALYYYTVERSFRVKGVNTRWRLKNRKPPKLAVIRNILSTITWMFAIGFQRVGDKLENLHEKIDTN